MQVERTSRDAGGLRVELIEFCALSEDEKEVFPGLVIQNFDVSPDGTHIVFDRVQTHSDIVVMNLDR